MTEQDSPCDRIIRSIEAQLMDATFRITRDGDLADSARHDGTVIYHDAVNVSKLKTKPGIEPARIIVVSGRSARVPEIAP